MALKAFRLSVLLWILVLAACGGDAAQPAAREKAPAPGSGGRSGNRRHGGHCRDDGGAFCCRATHDTCLDEHGSTIPDVCFARQTGVAPDIHSDEQTRADLNIHSQRSPLHR